jgi:hypothetical protein
VPAVVWMLDFKPLRRPLLARHLPWHLLASVAFCLTHVVTMVLLRKLIYALQAEHYDFGPWLAGLFYESLKDIRAYVLIAAVVLSYRLLLWRWQGKARWLDVADTPGTTGPNSAALSQAAPARILVKKQGKEFLLPTAEIEWVQACGNYVNLHHQQHNYPLRSTLAGVEKRLANVDFVRVHRSYLVNLAHVQVIEPTEAGDARLRLRDGASLPCSRTYLDALRSRLSSPPLRSQAAAFPHRVHPS